MTTHETESTTPNEVAAARADAAAADTHLLDAVLEFLRVYDQHRRELGFVPQHPTPQDPTYASLAAAKARLREAEAARDAAAARLDLLAGVGRQGSK